MDKLSDLLLRKPMSDAWLISLLFVFFTLHMLFVLFTLGTGILSAYYFLLAWRRDRLGDLRWHKDILHTFMAHKSLTVVLGIGPLLLMQVGFTVPFFNAVTLLAPYWLLVIILIVVAFLFLELAGQHRERRHSVDAALVLIGLGCLLAVPAVFIAVLTLTENPDRWLSMATRGYRLPPELTFHWLFRYLHILGAATVFGAAFHYLASKPDESEKRQSLLRWIVGGLLSQVLIGVVLYSSVPRGLGVGGNLAVFVGILAAIVLLWRLYSRPLFDVRVAGPLLGVLLISMLLARQIHQYSGVDRLQKDIRQAEIAYRSRLMPFRRDALRKYQSSLDVVYDNGDTIYSGSCAFCHGANGDGRGSEARNLSIRPEKLAAIRVKRPYLEQILLHGVDHTAMPYFSVFTTDKLDSLMKTLNDRFGVLSAVEPLARPVSKQAHERAVREFATTCAQCHGESGRISAIGRSLAPAPPDLTQYTLMPQRTFEVITDGYPGTSMPSYNSLPPEVRWGLVELVQGLFEGTNTGG